MITTSRAHSPPLLSLFLHVDLVSSLPSSSPSLLCPRLFLIGKRADGRKDERSSKPGCSLMRKGECSSGSFSPFSHLKPYYHSQHAHIFPFLLHTPTHKTAFLFELSAAVCSKKRRRQKYGGERRTLQGEFDFHFVLTHTHNYTRCPSWASKQAHACWTTSEKPLKCTPAHTLFVSILCLMHIY